MSQIFGGMDSEVRASRWFLLATWSVAAFFSACGLPEDGAGPFDGSPDAFVTDGANEPTDVVTPDAGTIDADASPPPFALTEISPGLELWLRSDNVVLDDAGIVTRWPDQSGKDDITRDPFASDALGPVYDLDAGIQQPGLLFQGMHYLQSSRWAGDAAVAPPFTLFLVGGQDVAADNRYFFDSIDPTQRCSVMVYGGVKLYANGIFSPSAGSSVGARVLLVNVDTATTIRNTSATAQVADAAPNFAVLNGVTIGSYAGLGGNYGLGGHIAEVAIWSRTLTDVEITELNAYAASRYGLSIGP